MIDNKYRTSAYSSLAIGLTLVLYILLFTYFGYVQYLALQTPTYDMGIKIQAVYSAFFGNPVDTSDFVLTNGAFPADYFSIHLTLILYPLSLLTRFFSPILTLLAFQWSLVALAGILLFRISLETGNSKRVSYLLLLVFLFFPPTIMSGMYDMHFLCVFPLASLWLYRSLGQKKWYQAIAAMILGFASEESFMILVPFISLQLMIDRKTFKAKGTWIEWLRRNSVYLLFAACAIAIFLVEMEVMHLIAPDRPSLLSYSESTGIGYGVSIFNLFDFIAEKIYYIFIVLALLLFIPLIGWKKGIMAIPGIVLILFTSRSAMPQLQSQYSYVYLSGLFLALIGGLDWIRKRWRISDTAAQTNTTGVPITALSTHSKSRSRILTVVVSLFLVTLLLSPLFPLSAELPNSRQITPFTNVKDLSGFNTLLAHINKSKILLASNYLFPHVAIDSHAYPLIEHSDGSPQSPGYPTNFIPYYMLISPSDFQNVVSYVNGFPQDYGLYGVAAVNVSSMIVSQYGTAESNFVLLYQLGYAGPIQYLDGYNSFNLTPEMFDLHFGDLIKGKGIGLSGSEIVENYTSTIPFLLFNGPSNSTFNFPIMPGNYDLSLYFNISNDGNASAPLIFQISVYSNLGTIRVFNVTSDEINFNSTSIVHFQFTTNRPIGAFSVSVFALKAGFSFAFYGVRGTRLSSSII